MAPSARSWLQADGVQERPGRRPPGPPSRRCRSRGCRPRPRRSTAPVRSRRPSPIARAVITCTPVSRPTAMVSDHAGRGPAQRVVAELLGRIAADDDGVGQPHGHDAQARQHHRPRQLQERASSRRTDRRGLPGGRRLGRGAVHGESCQRGADTGVSVRVSRRALDRPLQRRNVAEASLARPLRAGACMRTLRADTIDSAYSDDARRMWPAEASAASSSRKAPGPGPEDDRRGVGHLEHATDDRCSRRGRPPSRTPEPGEVREVVWSGEAPARAWVRGSRWHAIP